MIAARLTADHSLDGPVLSLVDRCERPADHAEMLARGEAHRAWVEACQRHGVPLDGVIYRVLAAWANMSPRSEEDRWDRACANVAVRAGQRPLATEPTAKHRRHSMRRLMRRVRDYYGTEIGMADFPTRRRLVHAARNVSRLEMAELALIVDGARETQ